MSRRAKGSVSRRQHGEPVAPDSRTSYEWVALGAILVATFLVYRPSLYGAPVWDDDAHITKPELQSFYGLYRIWFELGATQQYYPLLHSAFWLEHRLWGDSAFGYHLLNLFLHMASVTLLYFVLKRLNIPGALLAAAIFALHPVMVESVAWISEQKNTLSAIFYLSAMLFYLNFDQSRQRSHYLAALALFLLGLMTKTVIATLPAALLVIFWWQRGTLSWKRDVHPLIPFFALGAAAGLLTAWVERNLIGAEGADFELSIIQRGLLAGRVIWFYLRTLAWPSNLVFFYPRWEIDPAVWWQWLFPAATLVVLILLWTLRSKYRAPLAGWLFFCGTLFPVLGFLNVYPFIYSFVADHFQYLASLGIIVLVSAVVVLGIARLPVIARWVASGVCVIVLMVLSAVSLQQNKMYTDGVTLYQATIARNPGCWIAYNNFGIAFLNSRRYPEEIEKFNAALAIKPDYSLATNNLGLALAFSGRFAESIEWFEKALKSRPNNSDYHNNLGIARFGAGNAAGALEEFRSAVQINPKKVEAQKNLGMLLLNALNDADKALPHLEMSVNLLPNDFESQNALADAYRKTNRIPQSIEHYQEAIRLKPDLAVAYAGLAKTFAMVDRPQEATATAQKGIEVARTTGLEEEAKQIETWLNDFKTTRRPND
jgi:tetratricopeptide (TPR) repeat protein